MREEDPEAETFFKEEIRARAPRFTSAFAPRGNEIGNALHQALQYSDFERLAADPESELNRLCGAGFILPRQRDMITVGKIRAFTESPVFKRLMRADYYSKEERFLFPMDAADVLGPGHAGEILIQGVLDCYFVENGEATVLDYKTDRVSDPEELARRYRVQMDFYVEALKRVKNLRVAHKIIYSFSLEKEIEL